MKILVTGSAGFIGFHLALRLLGRGDEVVGLDSINDYYDTELKFARLAKCGIGDDVFEWNRPTASSRFPNYRFLRMKLEDKEGLAQLFRAERFDAVVNLAAQAGVRYSLTNPYAYVESNILGFTGILENCRHSTVKHLVYASSSSVYGLNERMPFSTTDSVDHPISLYAASKKANELMAHSYSHLFGLPTSGLRFFTVYGPWGRPDMALFIFTKAILEGRPIDVFNNGKMKRDFTYVDDIVSGIVGVLDNPPRGNPSWSGLKPDPASSKAPYRVYNIGNSSPVLLMDFISEIEKNLGRKAILNRMPMQRGDVPATWADISAIREETGYKPMTSVPQGIAAFVSWYREYYGV
jgi:UDP-glucuronate 4-epimerase